MFYLQILIFKDVAYDGEIFMIALLGMAGDSLPWLPVPSSIEETKLTSSGRRIDSSSRS